MENRTYFNLLCLLLIFFTTSNNVFSQANCQNCPLPFGPNVFGQGLIISQINVETDGPNDLGLNPLEQVCVNIQHPWLSDLFLVLVSPGGQNYFLMADDNNGLGGCAGPGVQNLDLCFEIFNNQPISVGSPYYVICGGNPTGTCLTGSWGVSCGNSFSEIYPQATTAPSCNLNDFNISGAPVEGVWSLVIGCVCMSNEFDATLIDWSLYFDADFTTTNGPNCFANGGVLNIGNPIVYCKEATNSRIYNSPYYPFNAFPPTNTSNVDILLFEDTIIDFSFSYLEAEDFPVGVYQMASLNVSNTPQNFLDTLIGMTIDDATLYLNSADACYDWAENIREIHIDPAPAVMMMDAIGCPGDCETINGETFCEPGVYEITLDGQYSRYCDTTIILAFSYAYDEADLVAAIVETPCIDDTLKLTAVGGVTYEWSGPNGFSSTDANPMIPHFSYDMIGDYTVQITTDSGCQASRIVMIEEVCDASEITIEVDLTDTICFDFPVMEVDFCDEMGNDVVSFNIVDDCLEITGLAEGMDTLCLIGTGALLVPIYYTLYIDVPEPEYTWPGDLNFDKVVNHLDALYIGQGYQLSGYPRSNPSSNWEAQYAPNWATSTAQSQINFKHLDANGNGMIEASDLEVVQQNWQLTHSDGNNLEIPAYQGNNPAQLHLELTTLELGQAVSFPLLLGTASQPTENVYALAFTIQFDPELVENGQVSLDFMDNFMGTAEEDWLSFSHYENGVLSASISRLDGQAINGFGTIAELSFQVAADYPLSNGVSFTLSNDLCLTENETSCGVIGETQTAQITTSLAATPIPNDWLIAPNPASDYLHFSTDGQVPDRLSLLNMQYQVHRSWTPSNPSMKIGVSDLQSGVYIFMIEIDQQQYFKRIVIAK